jgi:hypothetical protein
MRTLGWTPGRVAVACGVASRHPGDKGRNRDGQCRIPSRSQSLHRSLTIPLKLTYSEAGRRTVTSDRQRTDACIICGMMKYVNLQTDLYCDDKGSRPAKRAVGLSAPLRHAGKAAEPTPSFGPADEALGAGPQPQPPDGQDDENQGHAARNGP